MSFFIISRATTGFVDDIREKEELHQKDGHIWFKFLAKIDNEGVRLTPVEGGGFL
jgi:hypothetical protein